MVVAVPVLYHLFTMGYVTVYQIKIYASPARKTELAKQLVVDAYRMNRDDHRQGDATFIRQRVDSIESQLENEFALLEIDCKSWNPMRGFSGGWYDYEYKVSREGLTLEKGERLEFECFGDDADRWRASVKKNSYTVEHAARIEFINKDVKCDNVDDDEICSGCGCCATVVPIYE